MPRKSTKAEAPNRQDLADAIMEALRESNELSAELLNDGSGLVAVVGFIDLNTVVDRLLAPREIKS